MRKSTAYQNSLHAVEEGDPGHELVRPDRDDAVVVAQQRVRLLLRLAAQGPDEGTSPLRPQPGVVHALSGCQEGPALVVLFRVLDHEVLGVVDELNGSVAAAVRGQGDLECLIETSNVTRYDHFAVFNVLQK